jgi:hypothetical protein
MPALLAGVQMLLVEVLKHLVVGVLGTSIDYSRQDLTESGQLLRREFSPFGHGDLELNHQIAALLFVLVEGHAEPPHYLLLVVANNLPPSGVESKLLAIQMGQFKVEPKESFNQRYRFLVKKVCPFASEMGMRLFLDH